MFKSITTVSVLAALLAIACGHAAHDVRDGSLQFVTNRADTDVDAAPERLTLTGLDKPFSAQLELTRDAASTRLSVPAGLYAVNVVSTWTPGEAADGVVPAQSPPVLVVVAPGRLSTINLREVEEPALTSARAELDVSVR